MNRIFVLNFLMIFDSYFELFVELSSPFKFYRMISWIKIKKLRSFVERMFIQYSEWLYFLSETSL